MPREVRWADIQQRPVAFEPVEHSTSLITSGVLSPDRCGSGVRDGTKYLRDDGTWQVPPGGGTTPSDTVASETAFGVSATAGVVGAYSRGDHTHGSPTNPVTAHEAAADPHTGYQRESEKNAASGYAGLDAGTKIAGTQIPYGTATSTACQGDDARLSDARMPTAHATTHKSAGSDAIKLDELAAPTDITTLNATTTLHGLLPKLGGGTSNFLRADGAWAVPAGGSPPTGTGFRHITAGAEDAAAKLVETADVSDNQVTLAKLADIATASFLGRTTAATGDPEVLTATQATALLNAFTSALKGLVPASGGGTTNFLRADGVFAAPPGGGGGITTLRKTADQIINGTAYQDITGLTFAVAANTDYAFTFYIVFRSAATTTGFRFSIDGPAGAVVDYHIKMQTIANTTTTLAATWIEGHCVVYNTLTVLAATVTANVDLVCMITGRIKVGGTAGTLAARVASELANDDLVVQKGSWGTWF